nr:integrase, catalytic region, zinc finger, CCHC-type, peptidase aspartic, catalytic [Tanacetum cinerariifolium]
MDINYDSEQIDQNDKDVDLAKERELLASLIAKLKCEIDESKNRNTLLETSNKVLVEKLKSEIADFKNKNKSLTEANNKLSKENDLLFADHMKSKAELKRCDSIEDINTIVTGVVLCKQKIANPTWYGHVEPVVQNTIEQNFDPVISRINVGLHMFFKRLNKEMVADLRYFNSLESEVDSLTSQLETQKTQFVNEIDRLSREYFYADHMNEILGVYTELVEVTNLQCDYLELFQKCECLEAELSKSKQMSKSFESVQKHAINLELELQQCKEKVKNDMSFKVNKSKDFCKERVTPTTSVSRPQLKSNPQGDRVLRSNSRGKKLEVEEHRRNVKLPKNKTSVTAYNDSLNAKTVNVKYVSAMCVKCVMIEKHDLCVPKSVAKPLRKTVASESNQKPRNTTRKIYERISIPICQILHCLLILLQLVKIVLFIVDSGCSKHMTGNLKLLIDFVEKFLGTVKFGNDQIAPILGYGNLVQRAVMIKRVYYVEGLNHNLFSVGQFYDADLEVAFQKSTCYIRDLKGNDLLTGSRGTDLYSITLQDTNSPNTICLMAKATSSKDETPEVLIDFLRLVQRGLHAQIRIVRTDKGTEFLNKTLHAYFAFEGILHQTSIALTPEQNGVVEKRNPTLVEVVSKSSTVTTVDAPNQRQQQHTTSLNNQTTTDPICQVLTQAPTIASTENINQAEMIAENAQVEN